MALRSVKLLLALAAMSCLAAAEERIGLPGEFFEQVGYGEEVAWRTFGSASDALIFPDGFALRAAGGWKRFEWDSSMELTVLRVQEALDGVTYRLSGSSGSRASRHAKSLQALDREGALSVVYYFGSRGLEIDVVSEPGSSIRSFQLRSLDEDLEITEFGSVEIAGVPLLARPVAYAVDSLGRRKPVDSHYSVAETRSLALTVGTHDQSSRLILDPIVTYATYFAGAGDDVDPVAIRELADGSVVVAANTKSRDFPQGVSLTGLVLDPRPDAEAEMACLVARFLPDEKKILYMSYVEGSRYTRCDSMDLDSSDRVLLAGLTTDSTSISTSSGAFRTTSRSRDHFLARLSAVGAELDHATYLRADLDGPVLVHSAPSDTAYLATRCSGQGNRDCTDVQVGVGYQQLPGSILLMRYDFAAGRFEAKTYVGGQNPRAVVRGIRVAAGSVYVYGKDATGDFPLKDPIQTSRPGSSAGFVAAFSSDLRTLKFGTYVGDYSVEDVTPNADGSIWLVGNAGQNGLPNLQPTGPIEEFTKTLFVLRIVPGEGTWRSAKWFGGSPQISVQGALGLTDGRYCLLTSSFLNISGGAVVGDATTSAALACINESTLDLHPLTTVGADRVAPSARNGIWGFYGLSRGHPFDAVPYELKDRALMPVRPAARLSSDDFFIQHIALDTPRPRLIRPAAVTLSVTRDQTLESALLRGENFAVGMRLEVDGTQLSTRVDTTYEAVVAAGPRLVPGRAQGRLVVPYPQGDAVSEPFEVLIQRLPPAPEPFRFVGTTRTVGIREPTYLETEVRWDGQLLQLTPWPTGGYQVEIPPELMREGVHELSLKNPGPGGGVRRQTATVVGDSIFLDAPSLPEGVSFDGRDFALYVPGEKLYVLRDPGEDQWVIEQFDLNDGAKRSEFFIDKRGSRGTYGFETSSDGRYVYLLDDQMRVVRLRTDPLRLDFDLQVPPDGVRASVQLAVFGGRLLAFADAPESFVISTLAGRLVIYDGDRPRPYSTADFPPTVLGRMSPLLATSNYIYAGDRTVSVPARYPCVVRYPVDALGVGYPEEFCNPEQDWDRYPEMKRLGRRLTLQDAGKIVDIDGGDLIPPSGDIAYARVLTGNSNTRQFRIQFRFSDATSDVVIGHFPPTGLIQDIVPKIRIDRDFLVYSRVAGYDEIYPNRYRPPSVWLIPNWRDQVEWYALPTDALRRQRRPYGGRLPATRNSAIGGNSSRR